MATFKIPTQPDTANYEIEVDMDLVTFRLRFKFNSRDEAWYLTVLSANGTILRAGLKVVSQWLLLRLWQDTAVRPAGEILTINLADDVAQAGLEDLGVDTLLLYEAA